MPDRGIDPASSALTSTSDLHLVPSRCPSGIFVSKRRFVHVVSCDPRTWVRDFIVNNAISHFGADTRDINVSGHIACRGPFIELLRFYRDSPRNVTRKNFKVRSRSPFFEIALVRLDHVASRIVNANHSAV